MGRRSDGGWRRLARTAALGAAVGLAAAGVVAALVYQRLAGAHRSVQIADRGGLPGFLLAQLAEAGAVYAGLGALAGLVAAASLGPSAAGPEGRGRARAAGAVLGVWAALAAVQLAAAPASAAFVPGVRDLPFAASVAACLLAFAAAGAAARVRWVAYAGGAAALAGLAFVPRPRPRPAAVPDDGAPRVLLLGVDALDRPHMAQVAARLGARLDARRRAGGATAGLRSACDAVSPMPLTRLAWQSVLTGRHPAELIGIDTLTSAGWRAYYAAQPLLLPREAARAGYATTFLTDDGETNVFLPGEAFGRTVADGWGWRAYMARRVQAALPLAGVYWARWRGVGLVRTPGRDDSRALYAAAAGELAAPGRRFVAAHGVALHGPITPTVSELGGPRAFLATTPSALAVASLFDDAWTSPHGAPGAVPQRLLYARRAAAVTDDLVEFLDALDAAGAWRNTLVVVFSDHGEYFPHAARPDLVGAHGLALDASSTEVGALVLLPARGATGVGGAPATPRTVPGTMPLSDLGRLTADFLDGRPGGLLAQLREGRPGPLRLTPAFSLGRPALFAADGALRRASLEQYAGPRGQVRLLPDGRIAVVGAASPLHMVYFGADVGVTDGRTLLTCATRADGGAAAVISAGPAVRTPTGGPDAALTRSVCATVARAWRAWGYTIPRDAPGPGQARHDPPDQVAGAARQGAGGRPPARSPAGGLTPVGPPPANPGG